MDPYSVLIFAHVLGAVALFAALGIEVVAFRRLRRARTADQARTWMGPLREAGRLGPVAMVTILIAGVWMMALRWGPEPWILTALVGLVVMAVLRGRSDPPGHGPPPRLTCRRSGSPPNGLPCARGRTPPDVALAPLGNRGGDLGPDDGEAGDAWVPGDHGGGSRCRCRCGCAAPSEGRFGSLQV